MNAQHTPGPWHHGLHHHGHLAVQAENGRLVTLCGAIAHDDAQLENHANSRLIAAAPDLFAALREIVAAVEMGEVDGYSPSGDWFREAKAALNKVEEG